ncbi:hypothetical protein B0H21DRAFT_835005 [Amylocystis lapponica]|nr:hypothetical protein B0H21DRAFT_835005 [Amylocystis lapponica]
MSESPVAADHVLDHGPGLITKKEVFLVVAPGTGKITLLHTLFLARFNVQAHSEKGITMVVVPTKLLAIQHCFDSGREALGERAECGPMRMYHNTVNLARLAMDLHRVVAAVEQNDDREAVEKGVPARMYASMVPRRLKFVRSVMTEADIGQSPPIQMSMQNTESQVSTSLDEISSVSEINMIAAKMMTMSSLPFCGQNNLQHDRNWNG